MAKMGRSAATWMVASLSVLGPRAACASEATVVLEVVGSQSTVSRPYLEAAQRDAAAIYQRIGVSLVWLDDPTASIPSRHNTLKVVLVSSVDREFARAGLPQNALGVALQGTDRAYIFCDRINALAHKTRQHVDVILGRVLAHELGHLMLGEGHSKRGIMQATLDYSSLETPSFGSLQGDDILDRLTRSGLYK